jgi:hypothetical protein
MMRRYARPLAAILFAAVLAATSLTMAVARGQMRVAGEIVLCTGEGPLTVAVNERGEPVGPMVICPDMALGLLAAVAAPQPQVSRPEGVARLRAAVTVARMAAQAAPLPRSRGPPVLI